MGKGKKEIAKEEGDKTKNETKHVKVDSQSFLKMNVQYDLHSMLEDVEEVLSPTMVL